MSRSLVLLGTLALGCRVGPSYRVPPAPVPHAAGYKEAAWKLATPRDAIPRGAWWAMFREPELDALQARLNITNQSIALAVQNYAAARAQVRAAEAQYFPTVTVNPSTSRGRSPGVVGANPTALAGGGTSTGGAATGPFTSYVVAGEASWAPDLFGRVRYTVRGRRYAAQATAADLESTRLLAQATLAETYFRLRGQDALQELLDATVVANQEIFDLTRTRYEGGLENESVVVQAELTLETSRVQAIDVATLRGQYEHAIASLVGIPATDFSMPKRARLARPPSIPIGTPSQLLERRPDVAAAERRMAAANAAIGVGYAAYFPLVTIAGTAGLASSTLRTLFEWPSRLWAVGASLAQTVFDGGQRRANIDQAVALYEASVASYRQTVLIAFAEVEDALTQGRVLDHAIERQRKVVGLAEQAFALERLRYQSGLDPYVDLMLQQTAVLAARQTLVGLQVQQMAASVQLVRALGGGWNRTELP